MQMGLLSLIKSDLLRKQENYVLVDKFFNKYIKVGLQFGTLAVVVYRLGHWAYQRTSLPGRFLSILLYKLIALPITWASGVNINPRIPIGPGFVIHNFSTIFIDAVRIGSNFTINQGVSVGPDWTHSARPVIGDNVFLGSGAKILGDIQVGDNVVVAANCVVGKNVGANCLLAGIPGIVLARNVPGDYVGSVRAHDRQKVVT